MNILIVCTGNMCRSPMAEHLLRKMAADAGMERVAVESAGIAPAADRSIPPEALRALAVEGVDAAAHKPKGLDAKMVRKADLILAMEPAHRAYVMTKFPEAAGKVHLLTLYAGIKRHDGVADPYGGSDEDYGRAMADIKAALQSILKKLTT